MTKMSAGKIVCQYDDSAGATDMTILPRRNATMEARKMRLPGTRVMRYGMTSAAMTPIRQCHNNSLRWLSSPVGPTAHICAVTPRAE